MTRYGPGGTYWANKYRQDYGPSATPLPIQSWQVWNEPNLKKYFSPGSTSSSPPKNTLELLAISHDAIKARDAQARVVLAGMPSYGDVTAWRFLNNLYGVAGVKADFDAAALHPYGCDLDQTREAINRFSTSMKNHGDRATPLWLTEFAWGSGEPDQFCKNKGLTGQRNLLISSFNLILQNRRHWNVQRLFWFLWRDPEAGSPYASYCSICGTAGLLRYDRTAKPAYTSFRSYTAETTPPVARIISGPSQGSVSRDPTPSFTFGSNEAGSTFACRFDAAAFKPCGSPLITGAPLVERHPHLLRQGDRRPRQRERRRLEVVHGRHPRPGGAPDHRHGPRLALQLQRAQGEGHRRAGLHRERSTRPPAAPAPRWSRGRPPASERPA